MTYCVGLFLREGLVLVSDTRTSAGVDNIAVYNKMHVFERPGERVIVAMTSGNLAVTQHVMSLIEDGIEDPETHRTETIYTVTSILKAAQLIGAAIRRVHEYDGEALREQHVNFDISVILAGQVQGGPMKLIQVYSAGNFIQATADTPFMQIGETKYGKPILDRSATFETTLNDGIKLCLISMDATVRSNLTVGMPIDILVYRRDTLQVNYRQRLRDRDPYYSMLRERWGEALRAAYRAIPSPDWPVHTATTMRRRWDDPPLSPVEITAMRRQPASSQSRRAGEAPDSPGIERRGQAPLPAGSEDRAPDPSLGAGAEGDNAVIAARAAAAGRAAAQPEPNQSAGNGQAATAQGYTGPERRSRPNRQSGQETGPSSDKRDEVSRPPPKGEPTSS